MPNMLHSRHPQRGTWTAMLLLAVLLVILTRGTLCMQFMTSGSLLSNNLTAPCAEALIADVDCDTRVLQFTSQQFFAPATLEDACTTSCASALGAYEAEVQQKCAGQTYSQSDNLILPVPFLSNLFGYHFNRTCLMANGRYCNTVAYEFSFVLDPEAPRMLGNYSALNCSSPNACDDCFIKVLQLDASSPFSDRPQLVSDFSSFTSSCSKTGLTLPTPTINFTTLQPLSTPALNTTCNGTIYNVKPGDDCHSISRSEGIGTAWLLADNHLHAYCSNFPGVGHTLCIKNTCNVYTISANDTCSSVASDHGIAVSQLQSWNPVLDMRCGNMASMVGDQICISNPGPAYAAGSIPGATNMTASVPVPTNIANGTNTRCAQYYEVQTGDYCNLLVLRFSISLDDFIFLNPSINTNCTNLYAYESYCVKAVGSIMDYPGQPGYIGPTSTIAEIPYSNFATATYIPPTIKVAGELPLANGTVSNCSVYADGDELDAGVNGTSYQSACDLWAEVWGVSVTDLLNWNPSLAANSSSCGFSPDLRYCMLAACSPGSSSTSEPTVSASS